jgi:hypothetical protein
MFWPIFSSCDRDAEHWTIYKWYSISVCLILRNLNLEGSSSRGSPELGLVMGQLSSIHISIKKLKIKVEPNTKDQSLLRS